MLWFIIGFIFICILLFSKVYIEVMFKVQDDKQYMTVSVRIYGLKLLRKTIDLDDVENADIWKNHFEGKNFMQCLEQLKNGIQKTVETINNVTMAISIILKRLHIHQVEWNTQFGTGDASSTGMAAGGIWTLKGSLIGFLDAGSNLDCKPTISVLPHFQRKYINSKINCIVSIRIGQAIYALIKVMRKSSLKKEVYI